MFPLLRFQEWMDERLVWDPADYSGLEVLRMPCDKLWLPDMVLYNRYSIHSWKFAHLCQNSAPGEY